MEALDKKENKKNLRPGIWAAYPLNHLGWEQIYGENILSNPNIAIFRPEYDEYIQFMKYAETIYAVSEALIDEAECEALEKEQIEATLEVLAPYKEKIPNFYKTLQKAYEAEGFIYFSM